MRLFGGIYCATP